MNGNLVEPDRPEVDRSSASTPGGRWILLSTVGLAGLLIGWVFGFTSDPTTSPSTTDGGVLATSPTFSTPDDTTVSGPTARAPSTRAGESPPLRGRVELFRGSMDLLGSVVLAVPAPVGDQNLWLIEPRGRIVQRVKAYIRPGGDRHLMMMVGDYVLMTTSRGTYRRTVDLVGPALRVEEPGFLIPDASAERAWLVGGDPPEWFAPFDGETGEFGERTSFPPEFGSPFAGYHDGVLFQSKEPSAYGVVAFWPTGGEPSPLGVDLSFESATPSVVGHQAATVSPGPNLGIVDLQTGERTAVFAFDPGEGDLVGVCLSEDGALVAAVSSTGAVEVFETSTGTSRGRISTVDPPGSVGWATANQLMSMAAVEGTPSLDLQVFLVDAGLTTPIARLEAPGTWRMATSSRPC